MLLKMQHFNGYKYFTKPSKQTIHSLHMSKGTPTSICSHSLLFKARSAELNSVGRSVDCNDPKVHHRQRYFSTRMLFLTALFIAVVTNLSQLSAKSDDTVIIWAPPIEPPGSVIVTTQKVDTGDKTTEQAFTQPVVADNSNQNLDLEPESDQASEANLLLALAQWSEAWQQQNMAQYLSMYADNFKAPNGISREVWAKQRTQRITSKKTIQHSINDLQIDLRAVTATVRFTQHYQDERLNLTDFKTMFWAYINGRWQITLETTR